MLAAMRRSSSLVSKLTADRLQALGIEVLRRGLRLAEQIRQQRDHLQAKARRQSKLVPNKESEERDG
jgi:hypothetical protein